MRGALFSLLSIVAFISLGYLLGVHSVLKQYWPVNSYIAKRNYIMSRSIPIIRGFSVTKNRTYVPCEVFQEHNIADKTAVILTVGQSMSDNSGNVPYLPKKEVYNFNIMDGNCYRAQDPLLGTTGTGGSTWSRLGDLLIQAGEFDRVLIVPIALGGSTVKQWSPNGNANLRLKLAIKMLRLLKINISHIAWVQGSSDAGRGTTTSEYSEHLIDLIDNIRLHEVVAPIFIALTSRCYAGLSEEVRRGQLFVSKSTPNVFLGPDTDSINFPGSRYDGCHLSGAGLDRNAELWLKVLQNFSKQ